MGRLKLILLFFIAGLLVQAQPSPRELKSIPASAGETVFVHTNANTLLTGETLYCKFYCLNPQNKTASLISKIICVELIGSDRISIFRHKIFVENGTAQGDFFIPSGLSTGNYKLIAYTKWMLDNSATHFFETDITIINPFNPANTNMASGMPPQNPNPDMGNRVFSLETDKKTYSHREKVTLKIAALGAAANGHYSISIRKIDSLPRGQQWHANNFKMPETKTKALLGKKLATLPELRGEIVSGRIASKKGSKNLKDKMVALSMPGRSFAFKLVGTDNLGRFSFILDQAPYNPEMVIQVMESDRQDYSITIDESIRPDLSNLEFLPAFALDPSLKNTIERRSVASQVENAYYERKKDSVLAPERPDPFFHPMEKRYVLDDYNRFPTLKETIVEVLKELYYRREKDKYSIHVRHPYIDNEIYGLPLVLIDGLLIQDFDALFAYPAKNIYGVDLINDPYIFGPGTFGGVISFTTKTNDFDSKTAGDFIKKIQFRNPLPGKIYFAPDYSKAAASRIPDYRHQLLWLPELTLSSPESTISFYTSDVSGTFEVVLEGFTAGGIPVSVSGSIEVR